MCWIAGFVALTRKENTYLKLRFKNSSHYFRKLKESTHILLIDLSNAANSSGLVSVAGLLFSGEQVGKLNLAIRILSPLSFLLTALRTVIGGKLPKYVAEKEPTIIQKQFNVFRRISFIGNFPFGIALLVFSFVYAHFKGVLEVEFIAISVFIFISYLIIGLFGPIELLLIFIHEESRVVRENLISFILILLVVAVSLPHPNIVFIVCCFASIEILRKARLAKFSNSISPVK